MTWAKVEQTLLDLVVPLMGDTAKGNEWVRQLEVSPDGPRLGACISIDVQSGAVPPEVFASIIDLIASPSPDARRAFADAVSIHPDKERFVCASRFVPIALHDGDSYVRVQELGNFIRYFAGPSAGYSSTDPSDINEVRRSYVQPKAVEEWPDIEQEWSGGSGRVFVLSNDELHALIDTDLDPGALVNDALGLGYVDGVGIGGKPEFVGVKYPKDFGDECVQPTTLDASWVVSDWYYVSEKHVNTWGRTQSCSGNSTCVRERVHRGLDRLQAGFSGFIIEVARSPLSEDRTKLLEEAYNRIP